MRDISYYLRKNRVSGSDWLGARSGGTGQIGNSGMADPGISEREINHVYQGDATGVMRSLTLSQTSG